MTSLDLNDHERAEYEDLKRQRRDGDLLRIKWSYVFQVVGYVIGLFMVYNMVTNRMTALEVQAAADRDVVKSLKSDVAEVKGDVKTLLRRTP